MGKEFKKYKLAFCLIFFIVIFAFMQVNAQEQNIPEAGVAGTETTPADTSEAPALEIQPVNDDEPAVNTESETIVPTENASVDQDEPDAVLEGEADKPADGAVEPIAETASSVKSVEPQPVATGTPQPDPEQASTTVSEEVASNTEPVIAIEIGDTASSEAAVILNAAQDQDENKAVDNTSLINTGIIRRPVFDGLIVLAQWQMSAPISGMIVGRDDSTAGGPQLLPSGGYQIDRPYSICALAAGGTGEIKSATATVNYPENIAFGKNDENRGCGRLKSLISLDKLSQDEASDLLCDNIRLYNNNLVDWNKDGTSNYAYSYEQVCGQEGLIKSGQAALFCGTDQLFYDDPAGDYQITVSVKNSNNEAGSAFNTMKYLELTMFEADFSDFQYGLVEEMNWKTVSGDTNWEKSSAPTIRNIGNTRLKIVILQNDFGFGRMGSEWNIAYRARLGNNPQFTDYFPEQAQAIEGPLNLGESAKIDFAVFVKRFPEQTIPAFSGQMTLSAEKAAGLSCSLN